MSDPTPGSEASGALPSLDAARRIIDGTEGLTADGVHAVCAVVVADILRDTPLLELLRIVCSARWGSLGRQIEAQRRAALAKAQEPAHV